MNVADRELRTQTTCLIILSTVSIGAALYWLRPVLLPFILALFFVSGIAPILDMIERRWKAPRIVAVVVTFLVGIFFLFLLWLMMWVSVASLVKNAGTYENRFRQLTAKVSPWLDYASNKAAKSDSEEAAPTVEEAAETAPTHTSLLGYFNRNISRWVTLVSGALLDLASSSLMVLIFMFFMLLGGSTNAIPRDGVWKEIEAQIRGYIVAKSMISIVTGAVFGICLWLFGIPLALVFGVLAFLLNFIPNIGPVIASLLPLPLILLDPDLSGAGMVAVILLTNVIQFTSGNVIEPKIMGKSFELHPIAILLTLMLWGMIWGIVGMFLAVPVTAAVKILLERFEHTRPMAYVLAGDLDKLNLGGEASAK